jgi:hypothetical protein
MVIYTKDIKCDDVIGIKRYESPASIRIDQLRRNER